MIAKQLLEELQALMGEQSLGFCDPPTAKRIYMNRQYSDALWYFWNGAKNEHEPIASSAIRAIVVAINVEEKTFKGKPDPKLQVKVKADRLYILECGVETVTAKGLIAGLSAVKDFSRPITIMVKPGDEENVLLCNVFDNSNSRVYDENATLAHLLQRIQTPLENDSPSQPQPTPAPVQPAKPVVAAPAPPVAEAEDETEIEYEFTIEDEQSDLLPMKSVDELTAEIKGMTINSSSFVLEEIDRHATHLGVNHGGVVARFNKQLNELKEMSETALARCKAVGMSGKDAAAKLGGKRDDCTLAKLKAFVDSIAAPATDLDVSEIPF